MASVCGQFEEAASAYMGVYLKLLRLEQCQQLLWVCQHVCHLFLLRYLWSIFLLGLNHGFLTALELRDCLTLPPKY